MERNRSWTVGLVLSLSILCNSSHQVGAQTTEPAPPDATEDAAARDPWAILQSTPGVLVDRINVGGNESGSCGSPGPLVDLPAPLEQVFLHANEMISTRRVVAGFLSGQLDFNAFTQTPELTPGTDSAPEAQYPQTGLLPRRGTNEWRATALFRGSNAGLSEDRRVEQPGGAVEGDRIDSLRAGKGDLGGFLVKDRLWLWGEAGFHQIDRIALGGQKEEETGRGGRFKLNAQLATPVSALLAAGRGDSAGSGVGAGPGRAPETTWEEDAREEVWAAESTAIINSDLYFTVSLGRKDQRSDDLPRLADAGARIGADGVARGGWFDLREKERTRQGRLDVTVYASTGAVSHEGILGAGWRRDDEDHALTLPTPLVVSGRNLGLAEDLALAELWRTGEASARTETLGLWIEDKLYTAHWTLTPGLQADRQDLGIAAGTRPWTLLPRLELNGSPGRDRMTQFWVSAGRLASRLGPRASWHLDPDAPAVLRSLFADRDGDLALDPGEPSQVLYGEGLDPLRPGVDPDAVDPHLRPEIADEANLGVEHAFTRNLQVSLRASWRRTRHLLEERLLVRDGATDEIFAATSGDWIPASRVTGTLPDGTPYDVPVFDLRPGLTWTGGTLLVNGDRRRDDLGLSLTWKKRLADRWMSSGHVTWHDADQHLGPDFRRFDDPTNTLGSGDDEGQSVTEIASGRPHEPSRHLATRWSFNAVGFVMLRETGPNLAVAVNGWQGYPLPYYRQVARERAGIARVQVTGAPDSLRTDDLLTVDAAIEKEFFFRDLGVMLSLEASNLLSEGTVRQRELDLGTGRAAFANETLASRSLRLKMRLSWR
jgi:hypothetical protein